MSFKTALAAVLAVAIAAAAFAAGWILRGSVSYRDAAAPAGARQAEESLPVARPKSSTIREGSVKTPTRRMTREEREARRRELIERRKERIRQRMELKRKRMEFKGRDSNSTNTTTTTP